MSKMQSRKGKICEVTNCGSPVFSRGHCKRHYSQLWKHGRIIRVEHKIIRKRKPDEICTELNTARIMPNKHMKTPLDFRPEHAGGK